jgi:demethylmacrocin O-methyltransferase
MSLLNEIGLYHGTDKASSDHDYLRRVYEREIERFSTGSLLELGWLNGASLRTWRDWLPKGWIVTGLDIEDKEPIEGVNFVLGSQDDPDVIAATGEAYGKFSVIIDDASHVNALTLESLTRFWPYLADGGLYFIEDIQTSYFPAWGGVSDHYAGGTVMWFLKQLADDVHQGYCSVDLPGARNDIARVAFWPGIALIQKAAVQ